MRYLRDWGISIAIAVLVYLAIGWLRPKPDLPDQAPDFALRNLEGDVVKLSDFRGQTVVLNFWATWCGPCRTEIPAFADFADENPHVVVLGIATDGDVPKLKAARQELGITYPVLRGDKATSLAYDISSIPTTVVVGPEGEVKDLHVGIMMEWQLALAAD